MDQAPRSGAATEHVARLIQLTEEAGLPLAEQDSMQGSLRFLKRESIKQSGKRLAARLNGREYGGMAPVSFFRKCYELRSTLVHGKTPLPTREAVCGVTAPLEMFVGHLISADLLDALEE